MQGVPIPASYQGAAACRGDSLRHRLNRLQRARGDNLVPKRQDRVARGFDDEAVTLWIEGAERRAGIVVGRAEDLVDHA
jgi:hypothetical protein